MTLVLPIVLLWDLHLALDITSLVCAHIHVGHKYEQEVLSALEQRWD